jgi:hypothetical protein
MATFYDDGDFTTAQINGDDRIERPFVEQGDSDTQVIFRPMLVNRTDYTKLPLDTPHPVVTDAILVTEQGFANYGAGLMSFERVYAQVPVTRDGVYTGTQAYTYPGFDTDNSKAGTDTAISSISNGSTTSTVNASNSSSAGDIVYITANWTGVVSVAFAGYRAVLSASPGSIVVALIGGGTTFEDGTLTQLTLQPRGQKPELTGSITDFTYYLPGVTAGISLPTDVPESEVFAPYNPNTFSATVTLSELTIPGILEYQAQIAAREYIILNSKITRYMGNILQRANVKVRAL